MTAVELGFFMFLGGCIGVVLSWVVLMICEALSPSALRPYRPETTSPKTEITYRQWTSVHERFHEGDSRSCTPCLACRHSCEDHEQLATSHDRRFMCHVRGCPCLKFSRLIVKR